MGKNTEGIKTVVSPNKISSTSVSPDIDEVKATLRPTIDDILKKQNLSVDDLFKCAKEGLGAKKVIRDKYGDIVDEEPDYNVQHKFFESLANMLQYLKPASTNVTLVQISTEERQLLEAYKQSALPRQAVKG